jgi:rhodanese-related sulfurtransferase
MQSQEAVRMTLTASDLVATARQNITEVSPTQAIHLISSGADVVLIDVREPAEFETGHITGAINIPRGVLEFQVEAHPAVACVTEAALSVRDRPLLICCRSGGRAALAAVALQDMGFGRVSSITGGILAWTDSGLPLTTH